VDRDPAFYLKADPDSDKSQTNADYDMDPDQTFNSQKDIFLLQQDT
jgi:hypothetical protein